MACFNNELPLSGTASGESTRQVACVYHTSGSWDTQCIMFRIYQLRGIPVLGSEVRASARHRILHDPSLHPEHPHRDPVLGLLLDQHRGFTSARLHRSPHRADDDDPEHRAGLAAEGQLRESHRRVDVHVSVVRLRLAARVRRRQCAVATVGEDGQGAASASSHVAPPDRQLLL